MTASTGIGIQNILTPLIGICTLIPLAFSLRFEKARNYSRKLFSLMLGICLGVLSMEAIQGIIDWYCPTPGAVLFRTVFTLFYVLIVLLCGSWPFYSYYWFNGTRPSGKVTAIYACGPCAGILMLITNILTGHVFSVSESGIYLRGEYFALFSAFCYLSMLLCIAVMAVLAMRRDAGRRKYEFLLFLLFIIFPVLGPVIQYFFQSVSVLGISQAIALVTVYVAVQQRDNAAYMLEMSRRHDENLKYEQSLEEMLSLSPDVLCIFRLNLTQNTRTYEHGTSAYIRNLVGSGNVDDMFRSIESVIEDSEEAGKFHAVFERQNLFSQFAGGNTQFSTTYHRLSESGEYRCIRASLSMLKNPENEDIEGIFHSEDIDRQEKEERFISAITKREYDFISLIDVRTQKIHYQFKAGSGTGEAGDVHYIEHGMYDDSIGKFLNGNMEPEEAAINMEALTFEKVRDELKRHGEYSYVFPVNDAEGKRRQKRITFFFLDDKQTEILFFGNDITEELRKESERTEKMGIALREARRASTMKTEFLSNVSHDMRTPLNAVLGYAGLARQAGDPGEVQEYLEKIERAGRILLSLINDTLDLSKIETGAVTLKKAPISCGEVISKVVSSIRPAMDEKHIRFVLDNSRAVMATINVDGLRLQDIFINLLSNAVKFTPENGVVTMVVECTGLEPHRVHDRVIIRDTGCGMTPEFLTKAFEPFTQERNA